MPSNIVGALLMVASVDSFFVEQCAQFFWTQPFHLFLDLAVISPIIGLNSLLCSALVLAHEPREVIAQLIAGALLHATKSSFTGEQILVSP